MSAVEPNESVPGKVNNLIGFFEELNDENPNGNIDGKQDNCQSQNDKQSVVMQYFSNGEQCQQKETIYHSKETNCDQKHKEQSDQTYKYEDCQQIQHYEQCEQTLECQQYEQYEDCQQIEPCKPTQEPCKPTQEPCKPTQEPCKPTQEPCQQNQEPCQQNQEPCQQTQEPCQQTQEPCQQTQEPCQQTQEPCQQTREPCQQTQETEPCQQTQEPCQQTQEPCQQTREPCQQTREPCQQTREPCQQTQEPCQQTQESEPCQQTQEPEPCQTTQEPCQTTQEPEPCQTPQEPCQTPQEPCQTPQEPCQTPQEPCQTTQEVKQCEEKNKNNHSQQSEHEISEHYETLPKHLTGKGTPTICAASYFNSEEDARGLKKAMKGLGTNEKAIIRILTQRSTEQRQEISSKYTELFGKDLTQELRKALSGDFQWVVVSLMSSKLKFLAKELRRATKGISTNEDTLIEILCSYDDEDLIRMQETYRYLYSHELKDDVYGDTSGQLRKIFLSILAACRMDSDSIKPKDIAKQMTATDDKGKSTMTSDTLRTILVTYTRATLFFTFDCYESLTGKTIEELIKSVSSRDIQQALLAIHKSIVSLPVFYAEELYNAMKGLGTHETKLTRIIVSRSEIDLQDIKDVFLKMTGKKLAGEVKSETSGDYQKVLLAVIEGSNCEGR